MAFGSFNEEKRSGPMAEINMVPLIDVMLVLLIVFMITAPLLTHSIEVDLPVANGDTSNRAPDTVTLSIDAMGTLHWNDEAIDEATLDSRFTAAAALEPQPELHLRADRDTRYQVVADVMSRARNAGLTKLGFVTLPQ